MGRKEKLKFGWFEVVLVLFLLAAIVAASLQHEQSKEDVKRDVGIIYQEGLN